MTRVIGISGSDTLELPLLADEADGSICTPGRDCSNSRVLGSRELMYFILWFIYWKGPFVLEPSRVQSLRQRA